jgi:hypothetical protein
MTARQDKPPAGPDDGRGASQLGYAGSHTPARRRGAMVGGVLAGLFSTLVLALAVVAGGISAFEQPEKRWMILASWGVGLAVVAVIIGLARWRGTAGVVPGALVGVGLTAISAGLCYSGS